MRLSLGHFDTKNEISVLQQVDKKTQVKVKKYSYSIRKAKKQYKIIFMQKIDVAKILHGKKSLENAQIDLLCTFD